MNPYESYIIKVAAPRWYKEFESLGAASRQRIQRDTGVGYGGRRASSEAMAAHPDSVKNPTKSYKFGLPSDRSSGSTTADRVAGSKPPLKLADGIYSYQGNFPLMSRAQQMLHGETMGRQGGARLMMSQKALNSDHTFYHGTNSDNLPAIRNGGIDSSKGQAPEHAINHLAPDHRTAQHYAGPGHSLLSVTVPGRELRRDYFQADGGSLGGREIGRLGPIAAKYIKED